MQDTVSQVIAVMNFILPLIAFAGYAIRIKLTWKPGVLCPGKILLLFYAIGSLYISFIFLTLITGWRAYMAKDAEEWSVLWIRPFFTYIAMCFIISTWAHPDLHPTTTKIKGILWRLIRRLIGRN